ncbi:MAG: excinuclease ABC subunit A, partial [Gammaproteobacteria bacterium]
AWQGQNLRDILVTLGHDVDTPWKQLPKKTRDWILYTKDKPTVPVYAGYTPREVRAALKRKEEPSYMGTFTSAREYVLQTFAGSQSALMKKRVAKYIVSTLCPECEGKRLKKAALSVKFEGFDIGEMSELPMKKLRGLFMPYADGSAAHLKKIQERHPEQVIVARRIAEDIVARLDVLLDLGLGHLSLERRTPSLSPGELQRLRLATQVRSNLFGVVYVLDEPSAGLHPADTEALLRAFAALKASGNSLFVVEHEVDVIQQADWIVDVGPKAGEQGGEILYSGPLPGLRRVRESQTAHHLFKRHRQHRSKLREFADVLKLRKVARHNLRNLSIDIPLHVLTSITGISGSGKSSLVQALVELLTSRLGHESVNEEVAVDLESDALAVTEGEIAGDVKITRVIQVDQKSIGRTPRSNLATYTGLFDHVRMLFARTKLAKARRYDAGRFSFNVAKGRCGNCEGEGFVMVELLFLPSVYAPCPVCHGARFNEQTLDVTYAGKNIAEVLRLTVDEAASFFADDAAVMKSLRILQDVGLGYLRLGQPATELSGGEAQRIKLATELQLQSRGDTLYILDEPTTGLHPADVERLMVQLQKLVEAGNTVIAVEHDMRVVAESDWVIDMGPGAGDEGGKVVAQGRPRDVASSSKSLTGKYLARFLAGE